MPDSIIKSNNTLKDKNILIAIGGGIAAYKVVEVVRLLMKRGANVRVMMTRTATRFVHPTTFSAISGKSVGLSMFNEDGTPNLNHLELPHNADLILVAPATADLIAKSARGIAEDLVTTALLAAKCPILIAPAMNSSMWENPATEENIQILQKRGILQIGPEMGDMASPEEKPGMGRLSEPGDIVQKIELILSPRKKDLQGTKILITAGRTEEAIDRVRVLTNKSSGRMGCSLAQEAISRGAEVVLVHGPMDVKPPSSSLNRPVISARDMLEEVRKNIETANIVIYAAAVADWRPVECFDGKMKRENSNLPPRLELVENPDIARETSQMTEAMKIGFALEISNQQELALNKMQRKGLNAIILNTVEAIGSEENTLQWLDNTNKVLSLAKTNKEQAAGWIIDRIVEYRKSN